MNSDWRIAAWFVGIFLLLLLCWGLVDRWAWG